MTIDRHGPGCGEACLWLRGRGKCRRASRAFELQAGGPSGAFLATESGPQRAYRNENGHLQTVSTIGIIKYDGLGRKVVI